MRFLDILDVYCLLIKDIRIVVGIYDKKYKSVTFIVKIHKCRFCFSDAYKEETERERNENGKYLCKLRIYLF